MKLGLAFIALAFAQDATEPTTATGLDARGKKNKNKGKVTTTQPPTTTTTEKFTQAPTTKATTKATTKRPNFGNRTKEDYKYLRQNGVPHLSCFRCTAQSYLDCAATGTVETCNADGTKGACQTVERRRNGFVIGVEMGCKEPRACNRDRFQNWKGFPKQCRPEITDGPSVCRQCCYYDNCFGTSDGHFFGQINRTYKDWSKQLD